MGCVAEAFSNRSTKVSGAVSFSPHTNNSEKRAGDGCMIKDYQEEERDTNSTCGSDYILVKE
jgi:hypothetical protein